MFYLGMHLLLGSQVCFARDVDVTWTQNLLLPKWTDSSLIRQGALPPELPHAVTLPPPRAASAMSWFQLPPLLPKPSLVQVCQPVKPAAEHRAQTPGTVGCHLMRLYNTCPRPRIAPQGPSGSTCSGAAALSLLAFYSWSCQSVSIPPKLNPHSEHDRTYLPTINLIVFVQTPFRARAKETATKWAKRTIIT